MAKALSFPNHKHPPSTRDPKFMIRFGALSNDQGSEGEAVSTEDFEATEPTDPATDNEAAEAELHDASSVGGPSPE